MSEKEIKKEITRLKIENDKAWKLVEELEEENTALNNGLRNAYGTLQEPTRILKEHIKTLEKTNKKLKSDNEFLKKMVISQNSLDKTYLGNLLAKNREIQQS